jgi:hypothetical protein
MVDGDLPQVVAHTIQGPSIASILNQALNTFLLDGDPLNTWRVLCQAADAVNDEIRVGGAPPQYFCGCSAAMRYVMLLTGSSTLEVTTSRQSRPLSGSSNHDEFRRADFFPSIKHINEHLC